MLNPLLVLKLKETGISTATAGLFAACGWLGICAITPFASAISRLLGRRRAFLLSALVPTVAALGFATTHALPLWFLLNVLTGLAYGLRWVLAEATVAELAPAAQRGRYVGLFETMVGGTFVLGPGLLAYVGSEGDLAFWLIVGLLLASLVWTRVIPDLPQARDLQTTRVGLRGAWHALCARPLIVAVGLLGGFFESGLASMLPLYGLALGLGATAATLLVAASGFGSALMMLPTGVLTDRLSFNSRAPDQVRLQALRACAWVTLLATALVPLVASHPVLAWPVAFVWGGAGGCLYTLAMIDVGSREEGLNLVNGTAVLVMAYTLGGAAAPALGGMALQLSPDLGFPGLLLGAIGVGLWLLYRPAPAGPG